MCPPIAALKRSLQTFDGDGGLENTLLQPIMCVHNQEVPPHDLRIIGPIHLDPWVGGNFPLLNSKSTLAWLLMMTAGW